MSPTDPHEMPAELPGPVDRNLALDMVRVTEAAALAASRHVGRGDEEAADRAAARAMINAINAVEMNGRVVVGDGEEGAVPWLFAGQEVGRGQGQAVDLALDPLEGATACARGDVNVIAIVAVTERGGFLAVPDHLYMDKIAAGPDLPPGTLDLDAPPEENLARLAEARGAQVGDLVVCILDRPRHGELIGRVRAAGARIRLINDGDVSGALTTALPETGVDLYMGVGGAPEGVLAAAGLRCLGGEMQARLVAPPGGGGRLPPLPGLKDPTAKLSIQDLASGDVMCALTGITGGPALPGVRRWPGGATTHSLMMRARSRTLRTMVTRHDFSVKARPD
ncbi:fructose-bisphosphatase class II family protein [Roseospirillum parvum]|uniref:Fructose-1,6-bisphosphatase n=1 Tax=Roseospirillum parvum TaxID=83401 RepID=A0A1G8ASL0_9PROT|nr:fructose-bisphosphatase class II family protein [Roseospirillum parvum]SDH23991.1 fructose-1,6-bisphosphatase II / sedoheptulose-1,7-bisphosphatase [Roseospirillum parvum]